MITYRGTDICNGSTLLIDLMTDPSMPYEVRGDDLVIPGLPGQVEMVREVDHLELELEGWVVGQGSTLAARQASWRAATDTLLALMDRTAAAGELEISDGYLGITGSRSVMARAVDAIPSPAIKSMTAQRWSFRLVSIDGTGWEEAS